MRKVHFISGLPRSGSTLLTNILLQNPKFQTTATSSLLDFLLQVRDNWNKLEGHTTYPDGQNKWNVIRSILQNYHNTSRPVIFDKNRGWSTHVEFIEKVTGEKAKIIACVRNLEDICTSFEKLFRTSLSCRPRSPLASNTTGIDITILPTKKKNLIIRLCGLV